MNWIYNTQKAINYIEDNLLEDIDIDDISKYVYASAIFFNQATSNHNI